MKIIWMIRANTATWSNGYPEYYRIVFTDDKLEGQFYNPRQKKWVTNSTGYPTIKWLCVEDDILVTELEDYDNSLGK